MAKKHNHRVVDFLAPCLGGCNIPQINPPLQLSKNKKPALKHGPINKKSAL